jgi:hypothetical protein
MKASLPGIIMFLLLAGGPFLLHAQTNVQPSNPQIARENRLISFLTPAEQEKYAQARAKALADNPELKTQGENLMKQGEALLADGTAADKQKFRNEMDSHRRKLRQAMLKEDPGLEPIFAQIDAHISEMKAQQGQAPRSPGTTDAPPPGH